MLLFAEMKAPTVSGQHNRLSPIKTTFFNFRFHSLKERVIIRAKSRYSPESVVGTGNCTLAYFCDSGQGEKKVTVGSVSGGSVGLPETRTFFFLALFIWFQISKILLKT